MATNSTPVILSACRTAIGSFGGALSSIPAPRLGAVVIKESALRAGITPENVDEVIMGNVLTAGVGQAPVRQASLFAGIPDSVPCITINKVCGSGLKAVMLASQAIQCGDTEIAIAGGMESMSNSPYLLDKARNGYRMGNGALIDSMIKDGLWDVYNDYHMGNAAELCARECNISREAQDEYAIMSYTRAQAAAAEGKFAAEITGVTITGKKGETTLVNTDEDISKTDFKKIPTLKPSFDKAGTVTAANSSKINDGAAALVIASAERAAKMNATPMAKIIAHASTAQKPEWFTTAPVGAIGKVLAKAGMTIQDIDLFEINEAFAVVALAVTKSLGVPLEKVNVNGGAVAMGHPIGASGARILVTLIHALKQRNLKRGLAAICIGGGEASALIVEMM